jgi:subtilisin family serine protease
MSGTSMAAPHVGGTGALLLSSQPGATASSVESSLKAYAVSTGTTSKSGAAIFLVNADPY